MVLGCDLFHDLHASSDRQIAERLRELEIDIAIDLTAHGRGGRPGILASRPVPIQVNYLGYPGTTGADFFDYIIANSLVLPPGEGAFYSEKIVRLPGCYQVNDAGVIAEATPSRAQAGLPESGFVYASFNGGIISEPIFDAWMAVLTEVDGSVLWLSDVGNTTKSNLRQHAQARGVDPARLIFAPRVGHDEHLARLRLADLFLDTVPCGARAAASDALWEEVPVVTCRGKTFASRVAVSMLHSVGLDLLIASQLARIHRARATPGPTAGYALRHQEAPRRETADVAAVRQRSPPPSSRRSLQGDVGALRGGRSTLELRRRGKPEGRRVATAATSGTATASHAASTYWPSAPAAGPNGAPRSTAPDDAPLRRPSAPVPPPSRSE